MAGASERPNAIFEVVEVGVKGCLSFISLPYAD